MKILVFANGSKRTVTGENGKFWICGNEKFRKLSRQIEKIVESEPVPADAQEAKPNPKKAPAKKKKKATEVQKDGDCGS